MRCVSFIPDQMEQSLVIMMLNQKQKQTSVTHLGKDGYMFFVLLQPDRKRSTMWICL